MNYAPIWHGKD
jgi:hypothetical protein